MVVVFEAKLWRWDARRPETWTFVNLPAGASEEIRERAGASRRGFGSVRVRVTVGGSTWATSIFPQRASGTYMLPVKRQVREAEGIDDGDTVAVTVEVSL